jgi:hypothetical protein
MTKSVEIKLIFSRGKFAEDFLTWLEKLDLAKRLPPWFDSSGMSLVMVDIDREAKQVQFIGSSCGVDEP